jgi:hypothetical protein
MSRPCFFEAGLFNLELVKLKSGGFKHEVGTPS